MAWIKVDDSLGSHPKLLRAAAFLQVHPDLLIGKLVHLWQWVMRYAPTGCLDGFGAIEIAAAAHWVGDPEPFIEALLRKSPSPSGHGFLERHEDGSLHVHDWGEYSGRLHLTRIEGAERAAKSRGARTVRERCANGARTVREDPVNGSLQSRSEKIREESPPTPHDVTVTSPLPNPDPAGEAGERVPARKWANKHITEEEAQNVVDALQATEGWPADAAKDLALVCRAANQFRSYDVLIWAANDVAATGGRNGEGEVYGGTLKAAFQSFCQRTFTKGVPDAPVPEKVYLPDSKRIAPSAEEMNRTFYTLPTPRGA